MHNKKTSAMHEDAERWFCMLGPCSPCTRKEQRCSCLDYILKTVSNTTKALPLNCPCGSDDRASLNQKYSKNPYSLGHSNRNFYTGLV